MTELIARVPGQRVRSSRSTGRVLALAMAAVVAVTACVTTTDVSSLGSISAQVADELKAVYMALGQASDDTLTLRTAAATLDVTEPVNAVALEKIKSELTRRVDLAGALGGLFQSLTTPAGSKVSDTAATAAGKIGSAITKLDVVHGGPDPQKALEGAAKIFFQWRANQDLTNALQETKPAVWQLADFYAKEVDSYKLVTHDDEEALATFRKKLIELDLVAPESLLRMLADPYGVPFSSPKCPSPTSTTLSPTPTTPKPAPDVCLKTLAETLIVVRATRLETALNGAIEAMGQTLGTLADGYQSLLSGGSAHVDLINQYLGRTKAYLQEAAQLRPMTPPKLMPK